MLAPWGTELQPFLRICIVGPLHMAGFLPVAVSLHQVLLALALSPEPLHTLMVLWQPAQFWPSSFASSLFTIPGWKLSHVYLGRWWRLSPENGNSQPWPSPLTHLTLALHRKWPLPGLCCRHAPTSLPPNEFRHSSEWKVSLPYSSGYGLLLLLCFLVPCLSLPELWHCSLVLTFPLASISLHFPSCHSK